MKSRWAYGSAMSINIRIDIGDSTRGPGEWYSKKCHFPRDIEVFHSGRGRHAGIARHVQQGCKQASKIDQILQGIGVESRPRRNG